MNTRLRQVTEEEPSLQCNESVAKKSKQTEK